MNRTGLGVCWKVDDTGTAVDCDQWGNLFNGICWTPGTCQTAQPAPSSNGGGVQLPPCGPLDYLFATPGVNCASASGSLVSLALWGGIALLGALLVIEMVKR